MVGPGDQSADRFSVTAAWRSWRCLVGYPHVFSRKLAGGLRTARLLVPLLLLLLSSPDVNAQAAPTEALRRATEKASLLTAISGANWKPGLNLGAAQLSFDRSINLTIELVAGRTYTLIGTAETERAVLDMSLFDASDSHVAADEATDATPVIQYTAARSGAHRIRLHLRASDKPALGVALAILVDKGLDVAVNRHRLLTRQFTASTTAMLVPATELTWLDGNAGWCIYGFASAQPSSLFLERLTLPAGDYRFALSGRTGAIGFGLYLANEEDEVIADSGPATGFPLLAQSVDQTAEFTLGIIGEKRKTTHVLLLGIFQK
ncbi:hypothetical protein [Neolewinella antarctica]|uniref:Uncharacterized protein n=1 Tax=Neolewinella antarctica TaxID=442734 RepID=A0ABX0XG56_9BACT|nr:hypothetical protein [Neolewinella antarctica]NJC28290.1 hypothetical protein [Neolewinella antarctica]